MKMRDRLDAMKRHELDLLLDQCTEKQQAFFARIYPKGTANMTDDELNNGIRLAEATIRKNNQ